MKIKSIIKALSAIASVLTIIWILRGCWIEYFPNENTRLEFALKHAPRLEVSNNITVDSYSLELKHDEKTLEGDSIVIPFDIRINLGLDIVNQGNERADFIGLIIADTLKISELLRNILIYKDFAIPYKIALSRIESDYNIKINSGDTLHYVLEHPLQYSSDTANYIHILIIYKNEFDQVFDTYCWLKVKINPLPVVPIAGIPVYVGFKASTEDLKNVVQFEECRSDYKIYYKKNEIKVMKKFIEFTKIDLKRKYELGHNIEYKTP